MQRYRENSGTCYHGCMRTNKLFFIAIFMLKKHFQAGLGQKDNSNFFHRQKQTSSVHQDSPFDWEKREQWKSDLCDETASKEKRGNAWPSPNMKGGRDKIIKKMVADFNQELCNLTAIPYNESAKAKSMTARVTASQMTLDFQSRIATPFNTRK